MHLPRSLRAVVLMALATSFAACGGQNAGGGRTDATLLLDAPPNAEHAGIYTTLARDYDGAERVRLQVRAPSPSTRAPRALESGRAQFALLPIGDLVRARGRGHDLVGVMALTQRPLRVLAVTRSTFQDEPRLIERLIIALRRGHEETVADPESAVENLTSRVSSLDRATTLRRLRRVSPAFTAGAARFGELDRVALGKLPGADRMFAFELAHAQP